MIKKKSQKKKKLIRAALILIMRIDTAILEQMQMAKRPRTQLMI